MNIKEFWQKNVHTFAEEYLVDSNKDTVPNNKVMQIEHLPQTIRKHTAAAPKSNRLFFKE